ncbi:MAG: hypothetical protein HYX75_14740 [Acidobacteria bacterium]|nr:hypothetical protein [Acidobacteriota bacterium]
MPSEQGSGRAPAAALLNGLDLVGERIDEIRVVICGAGTVGTGCARLLLRLGVRAENLLVYDVAGLPHPDRADLHEYQRTFARANPAQQLAQGLRGADVFIGASAPGVCARRPRAASTGSRARGARPRMLHG